MTIAAFILGGALAWLHFEAWGPVVAPHARVWVVWMGVVTLALVIQAWRGRDHAVMVAGAVLFASYVIANFTWVFSREPLMAHSARNVLVALVLLVIAVKSGRRIFVAPMALYIAVVAAAALTEAKIIFYWPRPNTFLAWSYPDFAAGLQHAALLALSLGTRERQDAGVGLHSGSGDYRGAFGLARVAVHPRKDESSAINKASA